MMGGTTSRSRSQMSAISKSVPGLVLISGPAAAYAASVTFDFTGLTTSASSSLMYVIPVGSAITGSYTIYYDNAQSSASGSNPIGSPLGFLQAEQGYPGPAVFFSTAIITTVGAEYSSSGPGPLIDGNQSSITATSAGLTAYEKQLGEPQLGGISGFTLSGAPGLQWTSDGLPLTFTEGNNPYTFAQGYYQVFDELNGAVTSVTYNITSLTLTPFSLTTSASPTTVPLGRSTNLTWSSTNATTCTASGDWSGTEAASGSQSVTPTAVGTATYTLSCMGPGGSGKASATAAVAAPPPPTVTISALPTSVISGQSTTLTWSSTHATKCTASGNWSGTEPTSGTSVDVVTEGTATFTLTCTGSGGSAKASAVVTATAMSSGGGGALDVFVLGGLLALGLGRYGHPRVLRN
jgi:hypothetical protein